MVEFLAGVGAAVVMVVIVLLIVGTVVRVVDYFTEKWPR